MRAINSVLLQSTADLEVVVVVDGPDPETTQLLDSVVDRRVRVIQNPRTLGGAETRNVGIRAAGSDWVAFLDDDDEWLKEKLELQLALVGPLQHDVIVSCLSYVDTPLQRYVWPRRIYDSAGPLDEYLFDRRTLFRGEVMLQCSSLLMSRRLITELMFTTVHDDWDMLLRAVYERGAKIVTVNKPLVVHHIEEDRELLGGSFEWRKSLTWADNNRSFIGSRAYAGFCLTIVSPQAAKSRDYLAFFVLSYRAIRYGSPRLIHFLLYFVIWLLPIRWRQKLRSQWYRRQDNSTLAAT